MAGFNALAQQVRDPRNPVALRRTSLRKCLERFAPYGHRATWHHLCCRSGIPPWDRTPEPARLIAALEELEEARTVWLAYEERCADRRRREKHYGIRQPGALDAWHRLTWGGYAVLRCSSPDTHPDLPLAEVLRRLISAMEHAATHGPRDTCPICAEPAFSWRGHGGTGRPATLSCPGCGIVVPRPVRAHRVPTPRRPFSTGQRCAQV